jgi:hypothetical protein
MQSLKKRKEAAPRIGRPQIQLACGLGAFAVGGSCIHPFEAPRRTDFANPEVVDMMIIASACVRQGDGTHVHD